MSFGYVHREWDFVKRNKMQESFCIIQFLLLLYSIIHFLADSFHPVDEFDEKKKKKEKRKHTDRHRICSIVWPFKGNNTFVRLSLLFLPNVSKTPNHFPLLCIFHELYWIKHVSIVKLVTDGSFVQQRQQYDERKKCGYLAIDDFKKSTQINRHFTGRCFDVSFWNIIYLTKCTLWIHSNNNHWNNDS